MSLQDRLSDLITAIGTDYKQLRTWISGSPSGDLTALTTTDKTSLLAAVNEVNGKAVPAPPSATETVAGVIEIATQAETDTGTDNTRAITPSKFKARLEAFAQPLSANLTTLAGVVSGTFGRTLLQSSSATAAKTSLGLASIASTGSASDLVSGTIPASVLPPLAINDVFEAASQTAMLALTAQRGDVAIRSDNGRSYILAADDASILANWKQLTAAGDVLSVAGKTGAVTLVKSDVGLSNVDNTSDTNKPVSSAQQTAIDARLLKTANLSDLVNVATARTNLSVYSQSQLGNPETDLAALYATAKT